MQSYENMIYETLPGESPREKYENLAVLLEIQKGYNSARSLLAAIAMVTEDPNIGKRISDWHLKQPRLDGR